MTTAPEESSASAPPQERHHFPGLDAYRGMGMLMVFLAHAYYASFHQVIGGQELHETFLGRILDRMDLGLPVFFVLSAFLLYRPYVVAQLADSPQPATSRFFRNRLVRIVPAYWVALLVLLALGIIYFATTAKALSFFAMVQIYGSHVFTPGTQPIYQSWSLATELLFYLLLPFAAVVMRRWTARLPVRGKVARTLWFVAGIYAVGVGFRIFILVAEPSWRNQAVLWLPNWLDVFAIGMAFAVVSAHVGLGGACPRPIEWLGRHPGVCWAIALALFGVAMLFRPLPDPFALSSAEYITRQLLYGVICAFWLLPSIFGDQQQGRIRAFLRHPIPQFFGAISLSFYVYHVAVLHEVEDWVGAAPFQNNIVKLVGIALPVTFGIAIASHFAIERPFMRLKSRSRSAPRPDGIAA